MAKNPIGEQQDCSRPLVYKRPTEGSDPNVHPNELPPVQPARAVPILHLKNSNGETSSPHPHRLQRGPNEDKVCGHDGGLNSDAPSRIVPLLRNVPYQTVFSLSTCNGEVEPNVSSCPLRENIVRMDFRKVAFGMSTVHFSILWVFFDFRQLFRYVCRDFVADRFPV